MLTGLERLHCIFTAFYYNYNLFSSIFTHYEPVCRFIHNSSYTVLPLVSFIYRGEIPVLGLLIKWLADLVC